MIAIRNLRILTLLLGFLALSPLLIAAAPAPSEPEEGAVVEEITKGWAAHRAGLWPGDLILSWSRGDGTSGPIRSDSDLDHIYIEQRPRGVVTLQGIRDGASREWTLPPVQWDISTRPTLPEPLLALYEQGLDRFETGDVEAGARYWRTALEAAETRQDPLRASWLQACLALELAKAGQWIEAEAAREAAIRRLEGSHPAAAAVILRDSRWIDSFAERRSLWELSESYYRRALILDPEGSLAAATDLVHLGQVVRFREDFAAAEDLFRRADTIWRRLAPESADLAWTLRELAVIAFHRGDLDAAQKDLLEAMEIQKRLTPESLPESYPLMHFLLELGRIDVVRGDLTTAEERFRRALALAERLNFTGPRMAIVVLGELATLEMSRGDLAMADERFRLALEISEEIEPESVSSTSALHYLGRLAEQWGDLAAAEEYHRRALHIWESPLLEPTGSAVTWISS